MERTQIYLDEDIKNALKIQSKITNKKASQIIREILRDSLLTKESDIHVLDEIAGIWSNRDFNVNNYIREKRKSSRLKRLYK